MPQRPEHLARFDIHGEKQRFFTFLKKIVRHEFRKNGFTRLTTSSFDVLEQARSAYGDTPLVSLQFDTQDAPIYALKSHAYLPMMRAYLEHFRDDPQPVYYYGIASQYRFLPNRRGVEQYSNVSAHALGESDPVLDATLVSIYAAILENLGFSGRYRVVLNCVGNQKEQDKYRDDLRSFFANKLHLLSPQEQESFARDPLNVFSFASDDARELVRVAPPIADALKKESREYFKSMREYLDILGVSYESDPHYVGDMRFFTGPVWKFEIMEPSDTEEGVSSYREVGSGGRYDALAKHLGETKPVPAVGCELNATFVIAAIQKLGIRLRNKDAIHLYVIQLGDEAKKLALPLNHEAQKKGLNSLVSLGTPSLKIQLKKATTLRARFVAVMGIMEARNRVCQLKDLENGTQTEVPIDQLIPTVIAGIGEDQLDFFHPLKELILQDAPKE